MSSPHILQGAGRGHSLRTRRIQLPPKLDIDIPNQMRRNLDRPNICRMPLRRDVVVLQYTRRVKQVYERARRSRKGNRFVPHGVPDPGIVEVLRRVEVGVYAVDLVSEPRVLHVAVATGAEALPH